MGDEGMRGLSGPPLRAGQVAVDKGYQRTTAENRTGGGGRFRRGGEESGKRYFTFKENFCGVKNAQVPINKELAFLFLETK